MSVKPKLLIVDDEPHIRRVLQAAFEKAGYAVSIAEDAPSAMSSMAEFCADVVLTDVTMPGRSGYELLADIRSSHPEARVVIMTAYGTIPAAVQSIRDGAFEYVTKPFDLDSLKRIIASAVEATPESTTRPRAKQRGGVSFIAESPAMVAIRDMIGTIADARATVLITGESGVGKEVVAKSIHENSARADKPFVAVSCAALPETLLESELFGYEKGAFTGATSAKSGRFELAHRGTLFLDEIGDIPMAIQVKLLRVLQEREFERLGAGKPTKVDVRLLAATNRDLRQAVEEGSFRLDLMYRLQVVELHIPPLRERAEDVLPLANHFLAKFCRENGRPEFEVGQDALDVMLRYRWPGNVRELENTMERAAVLAPREALRLDATHLPPSMRQAA